jgi:hypothetical protein
MLIACIFIRYTFRHHCDRTVCVSQTSVETSIETYRTIIVPVVSIWSHIQQVLEMFPEVIRPERETDISRPCSEILLNGFCIHVTWTLLENKNTRYGPTSTGNRFEVHLLCSALSVMPCVGNLTDETPPVDVLEFPIDLWILEKCQKYVSVAYRPVAN